MVKRTFDIVAALAGLVLFSPVLLLAAVAIRADSVGPIIFRQRRVGRYFQPFLIYKFRTMRHEVDSRRAITVDGDAPVTRVGRWLRASKADELPQLFNVLRGDMSIVGPRPEVPRYVELFRQEYRAVLRVRPGLTDPAAVKYRDESALLSRARDPEAEYVRRILPDKIRLSTDYVRHASLLLDVQVVVRTLVALLPGSRGALALGAMVLLAFTSTAMLPRVTGEGAEPGVIVGPDPREWHAAPYGRNDGSGTADDPLDLATAIARRGPVAPGDTVWLAPGVYRGSYTSTIAGTATRPIVVRGASAWSVRLDAEGAKASPLIVRGAWTVFRDLEITNSNAERKLLASGSRAADNLRRDGVVVYGPHTTLVNLIVHDNGDGISLWGPARDAQVYGCIVYANGWLGPDRGHGHGLYIQSQADTKRLTDVVSFDNFATGMKAYAERGTVDGVEFDGIVSFNNGSPGDSRTRMPNLFVGSTTVPAGHVSLSNSFLYHEAETETDLGGNLSLGFTARGNGHAIVRSSYVVGGHRAIALRDWQTVAIDASTFVVSGPVGTERPRLVEFRRPNVDSNTPESWNGNRYISGHDDGLFTLDGRRVDFRRWRELTGFDRSSSHTTSVPQGAEVFVRPNRYESGRGHIVVFNWRREGSVEVDVSTAGLRAGEQFEIRDMRNLFEPPLVAATLTGPHVRLPMDASGPAPEFAAFLIRRVTGAVRKP